MDIKPIETLYKGYRFRSRLEARWAVFFDALGINWEYEKEGYVINGKPYLPDFWLSDLQVFAEIKPASEQPAEPVHELMNGFRESVGAILLLIGPPAELMPGGIVFCTEVDDSGGGAYEQSVCFMKPGNNILLVPCSDKRERAFYQDWNMQEPLNSMLSSCKVKGIPGIELFHLASCKARSARFEHGETPQ